MNPPILALTMGDVNGVGPEIIAKALADPALRAAHRFVVVGSAAAYEAARRIVSEAPVLTPVDRIDAPVPKGAVAIWDAGAEAPPWRPGTLDAQAGHCAVVWVKAAIHAAMAGSVAAVVTGPLNKEGIHRAGYTYAGHTELIAEETGTTAFRLALFSDKLRIVHNSTHCALREAIELVNPARVAETIRIADGALRRLGFEAPRLAICGLNPHAGEAGAFGREEIDAIVPAMEQCRRDGIQCDGPHPGDTVFNRMMAGESDMVVAMFHDQGHIAMKVLGMDEGVNVTLGVPIIRTSVDHGTAYDIAGTGRARPDSLRAAIRLADQLARSRGGG